MSTTRAHPRLTRDLVIAALIALAMVGLARGGVAAADLTAPTIDAPVLAPSAANGGASVTVTTTALDDAGVAGAQVQVDGGVWSPLTPASGAFGDATVDLTGSVGASGASAIAIGDFNGCALLADGIVRCWGQRGYNMFGYPTNEPQPSPVAIADLEGVTAVDLGRTHGCAIVADTSLRCWGGNWAGQLGDGTTSDRVPAAAVPGLVGATSVGTGLMHTCVTVTGGSVRCWGTNSVGELGDGTTTQRRSPVTVPGVSTATNVVAGYASTCALLVDATVRCWGLNQSGQLGDGTGSLYSTTPVTVAGLSGVTEVDIGMGHACAVMADTTVRCWGDNEYGQLGDGTTDDRSSPVEVVGLTGVTAIATSAGGVYTCALLVDTTVTCWGLDTVQTIAGGSGNVIELTPVTVSGLSGVTALGAGSGNICVLVTDGTMRCWGANGGGLLGDGTVVDRLVPTPVVGLEGALDGGDHEVCVRATDTSGNASDGTACATLAIRYGHTEVGKAIRVHVADPVGGPSPFTATFQDVSSPGETSVTTSSTGPATPASFVFGDPVAYHTFATTATFTRTTICLDVAGMGYPGVGELRMYQHDGADWNEITFTRDGTAVCGHQITSFEPIIVVEYLYGVTGQDGEEVILATPDGTRSDVRATFDGVTAPGVSTASAGSSGPSLPATFQLGDPAVYYELSSTATFGSATVCFPTWTSYFPDPSLLRLLHFEDGDWVDVTLPGDPWSGEICGLVSSFSPFVVAQRSFTFSGFFAPIDAQPTVNVAKAGGALPIVFGVGGDAGPDVLAAGYPKVVKTACDTLAPLDEIETVAPAGQSGLTYDAGTQRYRYVWKTDKAWAGSCRQLVLRLADGTEYRADFSFRK